MAQDERRELRSIFRAQALEHHQRGRWTEVLPPAARPRAFRRLWVALGVLVLLIAGLAAVPVPTYGTGSAFAVAGADVGRPADAVALVVLLPVTDLARLTDGAPAVLQQGDIRGTVAWHEPAGLSRAEVVSRFGLPDVPLPDPAAVAVVRLDVGTVEIGNRFPARVEVGSRSVLAGLPLIGGLFG